MDQKQFDDITKTLAAGADRRSVLKRIAGGALGGLFALAGASRADATHKKGHHCTPSDKHGCPKGYKCVDHKCVTTTTKKPTTTTKKPTTTTKKPTTTTKKPTTTTKRPTTTTKNPHKCGSYGDYCSKSKKCCNGYYCGKFGRCKKKWF